MTTPGHRFTALRSAASAATLLLLVACGGGSGQISGTVTGLTADGLTLASGGETIALGANTTRFQFAGSLDDGDRYDVTVTAQPTGLSCSVAGGSGSFGGTDISNVVVTCVPVFGISGTVSGLRNGGLVLRNGGEAVTVASGAATFFFTTRLVDGTAYAVTVGTQPTGQSCTVANGTGTIASAAVSNVAVTCTSTVQPLGAV